MVLQTEITRQKKIPAWNIPTDVFRRWVCEIPTDYFHRSGRRWLWNLHQATVKCRQINSVCKFVSKISNADGYSPLVKPSVIIFKYAYKKLFRIHNIKLYTLIVKKTNYANKICIKHKKKLNNIHYKLNVFKKNIKLTIKLNNIHYKLT
jgi:hypothetical protein